MIFFDKDKEGDFLLITGDAYVDHPSFGAAIIARVLEAEGYCVRIISQPDWKAKGSLGRRPRLGVLITSGNIDSMVAHYTAAKKRRAEDVYSPGGIMGKRPDRACIVYSNMAKMAFPGIKVVLGGLEASLRRFAHYDYWEDRVRRSILIDGKADILIYGMGEKAVIAAAKCLKEGSSLEGIPGTCWVSRVIPKGAKYCPSFEEVEADKKKYADSALIQYRTHDPINGNVLYQAHGDRYLICERPAMPLEGKEMDRVYALPYTGRPIPEAEIKAIEEVRFSIANSRGCFGACNFCSLAFHQGRMVTSRSEDSVLKEAEKLTELPDFKGYIHDIGGPSANMTHASCKKQAVKGMCRRNCLTPEPCGNLDTSHRDYLRLLRKLRDIPGVKKVFIRSGIRLDYMLLDRSGLCMAEIIEHHVSGQLKVAPEHCATNALRHMGKPSWQTFLDFKNLYEKINKRLGKKQFLVPYLMSSHPGCTLKDAVELAENLNKLGITVEQVQDFYPTPGTVSTCMYYTGINPLTGEKVYVPKTPKEKAMQRALLQWKNPKNRGLAEAALREAGREDLIGYGKRCLIRPREFGKKRK